MSLPGEVVPVTYAVPAHSRVSRLHASGADAPLAFARDASLPALFAEVVRAHPGAEAVAWGSERLSYAELDARADRLARRLRDAGVRPGERVGLALERSAPLVTAMLAVLKAGASYVPLDPAYPAERRAFMRRDAGVAALVVARAADARLDPGERVRVVALDEARAAVAAQPDDVPSAASFGGSEAYVVYTSGSTGTPKGIACTHRGVARLARGADYVRLGPGDRVAQLSNTSFDAATFEVWGALLSGATLVGLEREVSLDPAALAAAIRERGVTTLFLTTALFNLVARAEPAAFAPLANLLFGGEAVDPAAVRRVLAAGAPRRLLHVYGPTESTTFATWHRVDTVPGHAATVPIGRALAHTTAHVLGEEMRPAADGELYLGGDGVAHGYVHRPGLTAERFVPDPFSPFPGGRLYRTGDLVRWTETASAEGRETASADVRETESADVRECGSAPASHESERTHALTHSRTAVLEFVGRIDAQVKLRGWRVEPGEIEAVLRGHPAVADALALVREDDPGEPRLMAYVVARDGSSFDESAGTVLRAWLAERLPEYLVPAAVVPLDAFPLNPNGKVDRGALPVPAFDARAEGVAPRTETEVALAAVWAEVLRVDRVYADDAFFDLGGQSLLAAQVAARVRDRLGVELPLRRVFEEPTLADLAAAVDGEREAAQLRLLEELEGLSDDEVAALLAEAGSAAEAGGP
jgi:amino acid adenylation domain-containing protein